MGIRWSLLWNNSGVELMGRYACYSGICAPFLVNNFFIFEKLFLFLVVTL